ncbi:MAG: hypothetical protein EAZ51_00685 [Sphingobacteriales bacterium]|nr:MAG: hypothetical protein EAZ51_00685 [Sphingobacteriales bacterium]
MKITHHRGALLEETSYYPFGLTMSGISSRAATNAPVNKRKFNDGTELESGEFSDGSGLEWYATDFRNYDAQIGRFLRIDPLLEEAFSWTPYAYVQNNPMLFNDPLGLDTVRVNGEGSHKIKVRQGDVLAWTIGETTSYYTYDPNNKDAVNGFVGGGIQNDASLPEVTVTSSGKSSNNAAMANSILWMNWASRESYMYQASQLKSAYTSADGVIDYAGGKMARYELKLFYRNNATAYPIKAALDKFYPVTQSTKATPRFWYTAKWAKVGARTLGGVGVGLDAVGLYNYYNNPSSSYTVSPGRFGANSTAAAMVTFGGPPGWITGGVYYIGELAIPGGWPAAMEAGARNTQNNREILGSSWNPRPGGGLGN